MLDELGKELEKAVQVITEEIENSATNYLRDYFLAAEIPWTPDVCGKDALVALVGKNNFSSLGLATDGVENIMFEYFVDLPGTIIEFAPDQAVLTVSSATVILIVPSESPVASAHLTLFWPKDNTIKVSLYYASFEGNEITSIKMLENALRTLSLKHALSALGIDESGLASMGLADTLFLISSMPDLPSRIPKIVLLDNSLIRPLFDQSIVKTLYNATGEINFCHACIYYYTSDITTILGVTLTCSGLNIVLENIGTSSQMITLQSWPTFERAQKRLKTFMEVSLDGEVQRRLSLQVARSHSWKDSTDVFVKTINLDSPVPFTLGTLKDLSISDFELALEEHVLDLAGYKMRSISAPLPEAAWKRYLPNGFNQEKVENAVVRIEISQPLDKVARTIAVYTQIGLKLKSTPNLVMVNFDALPLPDGPHDYLLSKNCNEGISMLELAESIGLRSLSSQIATHAPPISELLESVHLKSGTFHLVPSGEAWAVAIGMCAFSLNLGIS